VRRLGGGEGEKKWRGRRRTTARFGMLPRLPFISSILCAHALRSPVTLVTYFVSKGTIWSSVTNERRNQFFPHTQTDKKPSLMQMYLWMPLRLCCNNHDTRTTLDRGATPHTFLLAVYCASRTMRGATASFVIAALLATFAVCSGLKTTGTLRAARGKREREGKIKEQGADNQWLIWCMLILALPANRREIRLLGRGLLWTG
jgi:hypothetical protein